MAHKIWLDAGHGGSDPGAAGNGWKEKDMNLNVSLACKAELEKHGIIVGMTRSTDKYVGLSERAAMANKWGADFFISNHHNGGGGDRGEVIHSIYNGEGLELAKNIKEEYLKLGQTVCYTYSKAGAGNKDYYAVIRETNMHAVITEGCFVDNSKDMGLFDTVAEQQEEGRAIARGILKTLGVAINPKPTPPPTPDICDREIKRYRENGKCTITAKDGIIFRDKPCTCHGARQGAYACNESVYYDLVVLTEKYVWISWISLSTGARRYMPIVDKRANQRWGVCI